MSRKIYRTHTPKNTPAMSLYTYVYILSKMLIILHIGGLSPSQSHFQKRPPLFRWRPIHRAKGCCRSVCLSLSDIETIARKISISQYFFSMRILLYFMIPVAFLESSSVECIYHHRWVDPCRQQLRRNADSHTEYCFLSMAENSNPNSAADVVSNSYRHLTVYQCSNRAQIAACPRVNPRGAASHRALSSSWSSSWTSSPCISQVVYASDLSFYLVFRIWYKNTTIRKRSSNI